jgi:uncharacterized protein YuzE
MKRLNTIENRKAYFIKNLEFTYDKLNDLLYTYKTDSNVYSTIMIGDFHVEMDKNNAIVGVEVLRAADVLSEYGVEKDILEHLQKIELKVVARNNSLIVFINMHGLNSEEREVAITMNNLEPALMQKMAIA